MAEPLLRRTFSRLRGRGKAKDREPPEPAPPRRQNWSPFSCSARSAAEGHPAPPGTPPEPAAPPATPQEAWEPSEEAEALSGGSGELGGPAKPPGPGAYLQSLERSSRRWVLSAGRAGGSEETGAGPSGDPGCPGGEGDIWYNPIPEDEDPRPPGSGRQSGAAGKEGPPAAAPEEPEGVWGAPEGPPGACGGRGEDPAASRSHQACGEPPSPVAGCGSGVPSPPPLPRTKSPGTVRRLSLRMRKLPELRRKLSLRSTRCRRPGPAAMPADDARGTVITRYHLDSSVAAAPGPPRAKGGYLSDGDSPEPPAREAWPELAAFRPYGCGEPGALGALRPVSGLLSVRLRGIGDLRPPPARGLFCVLQVDSAARARTALLPCARPFLALDHSFNLELEAARLLKVVVFSWEPGDGHHRLCCHGAVGLPHVFQGSRSQQLAVRLQPRGVLYWKLTLLEQREAPGERRPRVFGEPLAELLRREGAPGGVPLLVEKCLAEIERRGLKAVGLYRLCGSAAVKKELREAFERDSGAVSLSEQLYPDINVVTGILKDFLRELPSPLFTPSLYRAVLGAMARGHPPRRHPRCLLLCLPGAEQATLTRLLDHLSLVASWQRYNRMTAQNLAVCFGPVLLQRPRPLPPEATGPVDFKSHLEVLHYLLQAWPVPSSSQSSQSGDGAEPSCPQQQQQPRGPPLRLDLVAPPVVARPRLRGPESPPSNRWAGDWSVCGHQLPPAPGQEATADAEGGSGHPLAQQGRSVATVELGEEPSGRLSLKDFDALLLDLERELGRQINVCL